MPFARVVKVWDEEEQTPTVGKRYSVYSARASLGSVKGVTIDTNFTAIDAAQSVNFCALLTLSHPDFQERQRDLPDRRREHCRRNR